MASNRFAGKEYLGGPPLYSFTVTPGAGDLEADAYALRVGTSAGSIDVVYANGKTDTLINVQVGETIVTGPVRKVLGTTAATGINAFTYG